MYTKGTIFYISFWIVLCGLLFILPILGFGEQAASYYSNLIQVLSALTTAVVCWRTSSVFERGDPMRPMWALMGMGVLSWGLGQALYAGYVIFNQGEEPPYPWFSDIGFLLIQPCIFVALIIFARALDIRPPAWGILAAVIVVLGAVFFAINASQENIQKADTLIAYLAILAYVIFDPVLLGMTVLSASLLTSGMLALPWWFCFAGLILYYLSNRSFEILTAQEQYVSGSFVDLGWPLAYMLIGVAAMITYNILHPDAD